MEIDMKELAITVGKALSNRKGEDIIAIDMAEKSGFADYFILCTAMNYRQLEGLADEAEDQMAKMEFAPKGIEGRAESGWILMDYGDIIISLLTREMREKYNIEKVWEDCEFINID